MPALGKRPFRKLRWNISQEAYDQYSPHQKSKGKSAAAGKSAVADEYAYPKKAVELDATPIVQELDAGPVPPRSSSRGERSISVTNRSNIQSSPRTYPTASRSQFSSWGWGLENWGNSTAWSTINTQYGPVPYSPPPPIWSPRANIGGSGVSYRSPERSVDEPPPKTVTKFVSRRLRETTPRSRRQPAPKLSIPQEPSKGDNQRTTLNPEPKHPQPRLDRLSSLERVTTKTEIAVAKPHSTHKSKYTDLESIDTDLEISPPSTPLLSASDEIKGFTAIPSAQYVQTGNGGQSAKQDDHAASSGKGASSSSKSSPAIQNKSTQGSEKRTDGNKPNDDDDSDDDDQDRRRKRKRFPPGDDPSSDYPPNQRKFACVYHKAFPQQYGVRNRRYLVCEGTGFKYISELIRHIARTHDRVICNKCLTTPSRQERDTHIAACNVRLRCSQAEKWHFIWRVIFPFTLSSPNPYFEPSSRHLTDVGEGTNEPNWRDIFPSTLLSPTPTNSESSSRQPIDINESANVRSRSSIESPNQHSNNIHEAPSTSARSIGENSAGYSVPSESTLVEEDAAPRCGCQSKAKGKEPQTQPSTATDFTLPIQIKIQLLGGRVESLERRLPFIEETIKMLSNLMSLHGSANAFKDPAMLLQSSTTNDSQIPIQTSNHNPCAIGLSWDLDIIQNKSGAFQAAAAKPLDDPLPMDCDLQNPNELPLPDLDGGTLGGMGMTTDPTMTLFDGDMLLGSYLPTT